MTRGFDSLLSLRESERWDAFEAAVSRLDTLPGYFTV